MIITFTVFLMNINIFCGEMVKTGEIILIEGLTVLSDTHCIELRTVGNLLSIVKLQK